MNSVNVVGKGITTEGSSMTRWKGPGRIGQIQVPVPVWWAPGCVALGGSSPLLAGFSSLHNERLLALHGVLWEWSEVLCVKCGDLMVILKGVWVCVFIWMCLWREREDLHSDVCFLCAYFKRFIDMIHTQQPLLYSGYHVQGSRPRTMFFWVMSPEGWGQRVFNVRQLNSVHIRWRKCPKSKY